MKKIVVVLSLLMVSFYSCKDGKKEVETEINTVANAEQFPVITFDNTTFDFGEMSQNEEKETVFKFKNTGDAPLVISSIKAKCGCTVPNDWPKEAILPGKVGQFKVQFNSRSKFGTIKQPITVTSNAKSVSDVVTITAMINAE